MSQLDVLPSYNDPPLDEVVLGVQFTPVPGYSSVHSGKIWDLYKENYPKIQELPPLEPQFETFGGVNIQPSLRFHVGTPPAKSRLWFISNDENHLLQYQPDMFLSNWRKSPNPQPYPRFNELITSFKMNLELLEECLQSDFAYHMAINQSEVTYINIIPVENFSNAGDWLSIWDAQELDVESLNASFNEVIKDDDGNPFARLKHELESVISSDRKQKAFRVSLTFKGKPSENSMASALEFMEKGHQAIVSRFDRITTDNAHQIWEKINE